MVYNVLLNHVSNMLNVYDNRYAAGCAEIPAYRYLEKMLGEVVFTNQLPKYNIYLLSAMCLRQLTTYSLWQAGCFKKLGKVSDVMREFYSPSEYHLGIGMY